VTGADADDISLVLPTFNRANALRENLDVMLALQGIGEVIVVDDGSTDDTVEVCRGFDDPRLKLVSHERNFGVATARNTGVGVASGAWILFSEDDCRFPVDYAIVLRQTAERNDGDIVGAPLLHVEGTDDSVGKLAASLPRTSRVPAMDDVDVFPLTTIETPFLPARVLVRRAVFERLNFYEGFPVNGYREETDFFVQAARSGFRCLLTSDTYCYQLKTWRGGQHHSSPLRYEYWTLRNNWRFLRRHGRWLAERSYIRGVVSAQVQFTLRRARVVGTGYMRARLAKGNPAAPGPDDAKRE
jgi:glycosyltransferase involved in cell wall biosynthesis